MNAPPRGESSPQKLPILSGAYGLKILAGAEAEHLWLRPLDLFPGDAAASAIAGGGALPLGSSGLAFTAVEILARLPQGGIAGTVVSLAELDGWLEHEAAFPLADRIEGQLDALTRRRAAWGGFALDRPLLMGIVNVTPDSFSDGGDFATAERAVAQGRALMEAGADIIDIGGESTRPGAGPVAPEEEIRRVEPVIRALAEAGAAISIDTRHARVMEAAVAAGAGIINDVSALTGDPDSVAVAGRLGVPLVLMHMRGDPQTMQQDPAYSLASLDVVEYLARRIALCAAAGIPADRIVVDPGIGFGKRSVHNTEVLARLALLHALGCGILLGVSRKSLIGQLDGGAQPKERLPGSLAAALFGLGQGVQMFRVHDVAETRQAVAVWQALAKGA